MSARLLTALCAVVLASLHVGGAQSTWARAQHAGPPTAPRPVYGITGADPVTVDNQPRAFAHPAGSCDPARSCYVPEPNPLPTEGLPVDSYTADTYERPTAAGPDATVVLSAIDVASGQVGATEDHLYLRMNLAGTDAVTGGLPYVYGFELDYDDDDAGDLLVRVTNPSAHLGTRFGVSGVAALWNANSNIIGTNAHLPDGPGGTIDGYEVLAFDQGANHVTNAPGGPGAVQARIAPDRAASIELTVTRPFLEAVTSYDPRIDLGGRFTKLALRSNASRGDIDPAGFTVHDRFGRQESGSPYPFLRMAPDSSTCPVSDTGLTQAAREALDSGTDADTSIANPCYPNRGLSEFDNAYYVVGTSEPTPTPGPPPDAGQAPPHRGGVPVWPLLAVPAAAALVAGAVVVRRRSNDRGHEPG